MWRNRAKWQSKTSTPKPGNSQGEANTQQFARDKWQNNVQWIYLPVLSGVSINQKQQRLVKVSVYLLDI